MTAFAAQDIDTKVFLDPWEVWDHEAIAWDPHPAQLAAAEDRTRHRVLVGGRRLGKSNWGAHELILCVFLAYAQRHALKAAGKRHEYWIVGPEYSDGEKEFRVFWNLLNKLQIPMDKPGSYNLPLSGQMHVSLFEGTFQVHVKSAKDPDRLVGEELTGVIMAEAAKQKPIIWTKYVRPMLLDQKGWSITTSTPEGKNHFYDKYLRGQSVSDPDWKSWRVPSWLNTHIFDSPTKTADVYKMLELSRDNPTLNVHDIVKAKDLIIHPEIVDIAAELTVEAFKQEIGADFTSFVGRVFKDFDTEYHCGKLTFQPGWETFACADYGFCVDKETEMMTRRGWLKWDEIEQTDECLSISPETGLAEWVSVDHISAFWGKHQMISMNSKSHSSFSTRHHKWLCEWLGNKRVSKGYRFKKSTDFSDNDYVPTAAPVVNLPKEVKYQDDLVELVAWYWTEGSRWTRGIGNHRGVNLGGEITQNSGRNADRIRAALMSLYGSPSEAMREGTGKIRVPMWRDWMARSSATSDDKRGYFRLNGPALTPILEHVIGFDKIVSYDFINSLTYAQLKLFFQTSLKADGSNTGASWMISQAKWQRLEPLQMVAQLLGYQTVLRKNTSPKHGPEYGSLTIFTKYKKFHPKGMEKEEEYTGVVWCPTTKYGTWLARRRGTVYFTGNTNPNVWLLGQIGPEEEINFLEEIYIEQYTPLEFAREIRRRGLNPPNLTYFYPDPSRPDVTAVLEEELMVKSHGDTGGEVKTRLDLIRKSLKRGIVDRHFVYKDSKETGRTWRPQMMFDITKCPRTVNDFEIYKYADRKDEQQETSTDRFENPMKVRDHGPEAVGRFMQGRYGLKALAGAGGESRVSQVRMGGPKLPPLGSIRTRLPQGKPERFMRLTEHEPKGYEYKIDRDDIEELSMRAYYDAED